MQVRPPSSKHLYSLQTWSLVPRSRRIVRHHAPRRPSLFRLTNSRRTEKPPRLRASLGLSHHSATATRTRSGSVSYAEAAPRSSLAHRSSFCLLHSAQSMGGRTTHAEPVARRQGQGLHVRTRPLRCSGQCSSFFVLPVSHLETHPSISITTMYTLCSQQIYFVPSWSLHTATAQYLIFGPLAIPTFRW